MENIALIESFTDLKNEKFIDRPNLMSILEEVLTAAIKKQFGLESRFDIIMNPDNGDMEIWRNYIVVPDGEVESPEKEIGLSDVKKIEPDFEVGEEYSHEVKLAQLERRTILSLRQNLKGKIKDFENKVTKEYFTDLIGELYSGEVHFIRRDMVILLDDEGNEILLPKDHQIPGDFFKKGDNVRGVIDTVEVVSGKTLVKISRTSDVFLERLFEMEIPEIMDGLITVKKVVRIPGQKAKVIVDSYDDRVDPVGACVGARGSRINPLVKELNNEYIDIINWTENKRLLITRALNPAKINDMKIDEENKSVIVEMDSKEISKAIGKNGSNIRLASLLTGFSIEIERELSEQDEDVALTEFNDEIDQWIIDEFIKIGLDTAKSVLSFTPDYLYKTTDLEEETIDDVLRILKSEFEK